jgi:23S rRNA pseudouridine1911/1915/1917 synthase
MGMFALLGPWDTIIVTMIVSESQNNQTVAAIVRTLFPDQSWSQIKRLIAARRVTLNSELCLDPARRVKTGDIIAILDQPQELPKEFTQELVVRYLDPHIVVVEKPTGINTVRHPTEREWDYRRRSLSPTLEDRLNQSIAARLGLPPRNRYRVRKVHRLDKLTSGLVVFARSAVAEESLKHQFFKHTVARRYQAIVIGKPVIGTIRTRLVADRGDGRRGSLACVEPSGRRGPGKLAITHIESVEPITTEYSKVICRLETGRTHQIRIHLSEQGCLVCGDPVYVVRADGSRFEDKSGAPRMALHAFELGLAHPVSGEKMQWEMPVPADLEQWAASLKTK